MTAQITQLDFSILYWIRDTLECSFLNFLMPKISMLGNAGLIWLILAAVLLLTPKYRRSGILLLTGLALGFLCGNLILKPLIARPRPCWIDTVPELLLSVPKDYSFPSGHSLSSVISAIILTATDRRFGFFAIPLAVLIAFSRLYLFVHFPSDVLAAVLLATAIAVFTLKFGARLPDKIKKSATKTSK